jgi:hypothetical protein
MQVSSQLGALVTLTFGKKRPVPIKGPRDGLNVMGRKKLLPLPGSENLSFEPVAQSLYRLR